MQSRAGSIPADRSQPGARLTRIIATIGPASADIGTIHDMIRAGMDIARLNLSHGTCSDHQEVVDRIRLAARGIGKTVAIMIDIPGPKLRVRSLTDTRTYTQGDRVIISGESGPDILEVGPIPCIPEVEPGDIILIGDGAITLQVTSGGDHILAVVTGGGTIRPGAGVVIPGRRPDIRYDNDDLIRHLSFAASLNPDFIALSFVSSADDIRSARTILQKNNIQVPVIAKIETQYAVENFQNILHAADGIMVARGDLGVELPLACVPHVQKDIIRQCNQAGVPVITATEMLESMIEHPRPTRAEVTDVANAIADGTDATMLSAETSIGFHPPLAVSTMVAIACETERHLPYRQILDERDAWHESNTEGMISYHACYLANELCCRAIVAFTRSGLTAERVSRCRPGTPIIAITPDEAVARRLLLRWGIIPSLYDPVCTADELFRVSVELTTALGLACPGDRIVIIAGNFAGMEGTTNMIKVQEIP